MRLALLNPNTSAATTAAMVGIARESAGRSDIGIEGHTAPFGAPLIIDPAALDVAAEAVLAMAGACASARAVIVAAFGDPGLSALRERLQVPVTGIAEAGMGEAAAGGRRFAVVTTTPDLRARIAETAAHHGHAGFAGTWTTPGDPAALTANADALRAALAEAIDEAVHLGGANAVVIGGGPLAVVTRQLATVSPVPLVEPVPAAVRLSLARMHQQVAP